MSRTFSVIMHTEPKSLLTIAKKVAREHGAEFKGDDSIGNFSGKGVEGEYKVQGSEVVVTITKKPFYAPWSIVEEKMRNFFRGGAA